MKRIDLVGRRFGNLTVMKCHERNCRGKLTWVCKCDCGTIKVISGDDLKSGHTKSCGCMRSKGGYERQENRRKVCLTKLYSSIRKRQRDKGFDLDSIIGVETFLNLIEKPCFYCGTIDGHRVYDTITRQELAKCNGVDRIDCTKGYTEDNVVPCCWNCNNAKKRMRPQEFLNHMERVFQHLKEKGILCL